MDVVQVTKLKEMVLVHTDKKHWGGTDEVRESNLEIKRDGHSAMVRMPKELIGVIPESITIKFRESISLESLKTKEFQDRLAAAKYIRRNYRSEKFETGAIKATKEYLLMELLGVPDRLEPSDIDLFNNLKEKMSKLVLIWNEAYEKWCKENNKLFTIDLSIGRFFKNKNAKIKMKKTGLTDDEIADTEMIDAVMRKIIDEKEPSESQKYGELVIEEKYQEYEDKKKTESAPKKRQGQYRVPANRR
jgi:antitoxin component of MazEF toxin-antitoxin module